MSNEELAAAIKCGKLPTLWAHTLFVRSWFMRTTNRNYNGESCGIKGVKGIKGGGAGKLYYLFTLYFLHTNILIF